MMDPIYCSICGGDVATTKPCHAMHEKTAGIVQSIEEGVLFSPREVEMVHLLLKGNDYAARELAEEYGWLDETGEPIEDDERKEFERKMIERLDHLPPWAPWLS